MRFQWKHDRDPRGNTGKSTANIAATGTYEHKCRTLHSPKNLNMCPADNQNIKKQYTVLQVHRIFFTKFTSCAFLHTKLGGKHKFCTIRANSIFNLVKFQ